MSSREASISKKSTIIIQYFLEFCKPTEELFQNIRLVSKPWKHAIETMKYEELDYSFWERLQTYGGKFPPFLNRYLQMFQTLIISIPDPEYVNFFEHWDSLRPLILNNFKNLFHIEILEYAEYETYHYPQNFNEFLCTLIANSQNTLEVLLTSYNFLPPFPLPNVEKYGVSIRHLRLDDEMSLIARILGRTEESDRLYAELFKSIITQAKELLPELNTISLELFDLGARYKDNGLNDPIIKVMTQNYKKNLYTAESIGFCDKVYLVPPKLSRFEYPPSNFSMLFDLEIMIIDLPEETLQNPFSEQFQRWDRFESFIEACTKLESVIFYDFTENDFWSCNFPNVSGRFLRSTERAKIIWKQRFLLLKSRGVTFYFKDNLEQLEIYLGKFQSKHDIDWIFEFSDY